MRIIKLGAVATVAAVLFGGGIGLALGDVPSVPTRSSVDISGPCDEAEHANDPRCTGVHVPEGVQVPEDDPSPGGVDISGPCDEAEHANDPRCTGAGGAEDRSGRSSNSGPSDNSGPSSDSGPSDNSGPGKSGRDHEEDD